MNDKKIRQLLNEIGSEDVPENLDMWTRIKDRLEEDQSDTTASHKHGTTPSNVRRINWRYYASRVAVTLVAFLVVGTVYAVFQNRFSSGMNPGIDGLERTIIQQEQTQGDITVVLDWAYADGNRIVLTYEMLFDRNTLPDGFGTLDNWLINRADDTVLPPVGGGGGGGGGGNNGERDYGVQFGTGTWNATPITGDPENLDLRFELVLGVLPFQQTPEAADFEPLTFTFDFTVPFFPATIIEPEQTVETDGIAVTLERVALTPLMARVNWCYTLPDDERYWEMLFTVDTGEEMVDAVVRPMPLPPAEEQVEDELTCGMTALTLPSEVSTDDWTITVTGFRSEPVYTPENQEAVRAIFAEAGIDITFVEDENAGTYFTIDNYPQGLDITPLRNRALDAAREYVDGMWEFDVTLTTSD